MTWLEKFRLYLIYTVAITLIVLAVAFSVLRAVLPHATGYVKDVEQALTEQTGLPVSIASMDADMYWLVPRLKLVDVVIYDKEKQRELLRLDEAFFALAFIDSILQWTPTVGDVSLVGADLYIERHPDNRWRIQGIEFGGKTSAGTEADNSADDDSSQGVIDAIRNTSFSLLDSDIHWHDYKLHAGQLDFFGANIFIEEFLDEHSLEVDLKLPEAYGKSFRLIVKTDDDIEDFLEADLNVYLQGESIDIGQWLSALDIDELPLLEGSFSGELWLAREDQVLSQVALDASIKNLDVKHKGRGGFYLDGVAGKFEWQKNDQGWRFNSSDIYLSKQMRVWKMPGSIAAVQDESGIALTANYLRLQDLIEVANPFLDDEQLSVFDTYQLSHLAGDLYNIFVFLPSADKQGMELSTVFENIDFNVPDSEVSFRGVDGSLQYADGQAKLELLSEMVKMDFGNLFRQPLEADLVEGIISVKRENNDWHISSDDFYLLNSDAEIFTRLKLAVNEDATVFADIQSDFINVIGASLHKYYPVSIMSDDLLGWLDMAISDGLVESGSFIMHGDLSGFPYAANDGVMEVVFDTRDLNLKFLDGWPLLNDLSSHIRFHNSSMSIDNAGGKTYRGEMTGATVLIPDLYSPRLFINGRVNAPAEDLQQYIWNSGLDNILGAAVKQFHASGEVNLELNLEVPLGEKNDAVLAKGVLHFNENELYLPMMDYLLDDISGSLFFEGDQMNAKGVKAVFEKAPVNIDVSSIVAQAAGAPDGNVDSASDVFDGNQVRSETVVDINGRLPADGLLRKFDWIPEGWVTGESDWDVAVHFPKHTEDFSVRVEMSSNLEGTIISLSDAVSKKADSILPVALELKTLDGALQLDVESEDNFTLFGTRNDENIWDFVVDSSLIRGAGKFAEDLNKDSTASLDLEYIDLLTLFKSSKKGGDPVSLKPTFFPSLNFTTKVLLWNDWKFSNARLETSWHSHGMLINSVSLQGPSLQIHGRGSWLTSWQNKHESNFKFFVNSSDFGHTLSALNLSNNMKRCEQSATVDWQWFDEPYRFSWQTVQGSSHFKMKDGVVTELDPGAGGRIVGLFNVFKLFDRLTLDFKDVAGKGFAFDLIEGDFKFSNGLALSNNIEVSAAAADMKLNGKIGMVNKDYNLNMQVKPHSSEAFFTGGALAGGPILGAGLVLINKLLGLEERSYDEYKITGSWEDPKVKQMGERDIEQANTEDGDEE